MLELPPQAAWRHAQAREGFEVVFLEARPSGHRALGSTAAVEDGTAWVVEYLIDLASAWATTRARVTSRALSGRHEVTLKSDGHGRWHVDGRPAAHLNGCLDLDLESSVLTNAFPVHRL